MITPNARTLSPDAGRSLTRNWPIRCRAYHPRNQWLLWINIWLTAEPKSDAEPIQPLRIRKLSFFRPIFSSLMPQRRNVYGG